jgi:hypothetical protein
MSDLFCSKFIFPVVMVLCVAAGVSRIARADVILATVTTNITIVENTNELLDTAVVTQKIDNGAFGGGPAAINADKIHFTFPFAMTLDPRFGANNFGPAVTLQDVLFVAFDTTATGKHPQALDGGDPISYAANGGIPIGAFSSDKGTDDDGIETESATLRTTISHQITQNSFLRQTYVTNYTVISPAEHGKPGEIPEPAAWMYSVAGLVGVGFIRYKSNCR